MKKSNKGYVKVPSYIEQLFHNINGGDCVDSAAEAQEIAEELLGALKTCLYMVKLHSKGVKAKYILHQCEAAISKAEARQH